MWVWLYLEDVQDPYSDSTTNKTSPQGRRSKATPSKSSRRRGRRKANKPEKVPAAFSAFTSAPCQDDEDALDEVCYN